MKTLLIATLFCAALTPQKCSQSTPPPTDVKSAPALQGEQADNLSKIGAAAGAQAKALDTLPDSNAKTAAVGENSVIQARAGAVKPGDQAEADARVIAALNGDLVKANAGWSKALAEANTSSTRIAQLEKLVQEERTAAALELQRQLDEARNAAAAKEQLVISLLLFGLGSACIIGAFLVGQMSATIPQFGPRAATGLGLAGGTLIFLGIIMRVVNRMMDQHPYLFWGSVCVAVAAVIGAGVLIYANHKHHVANAPQPVAP